MLVGVPQVHPLSDDSKGSTRVSRWKVTEGFGLFGISSVSLVPSDQKSVMLTSKERK